MRVVISQPMFFPWVGILEKIRQCDVFVHYDDVQYSKGSFTNRVQVKTSCGLQWLTVPLFNLHLGQSIREVCIDNRQDWKSYHFALLRMHYQDSPYRADLLKLVEHVYAQSWERISDLSIASIEELCMYFGIWPAKHFICSSELGISGRGSQRVLDIVRRLEGSVYICGAGSQHVDQRYLDHDAFELAGIRVEYMNYKRHRYDQLHGEFNPNVSTLDLVANTGRSGVSLINSRSVYWKEFEHVRSSSEPSDTAV